MNFFLPLEEIHVWFFPVSLLNETNACFQRHFFNSEVASSRDVLRSLLSRYLNSSPEELVFQKTTHGKLFLPEHPHFFFNMAHSGDLLALVFSHTPVGIDLEKKRKVKALALANKFFSAEEIDFITSEGEASIEKKFLQLWTAKEAVLKADGRGITEGLREVFAIIEDNKIVSLTLEKQPWHVASWFLRSNAQHVSKPAEYAGAVATLLADPLTRIFHLSLLRKPGSPMDTSLGSDFNLDSMYTYSPASKSSPA
ncbi:MAG: 4'-phosphopantetheinyl transferase superfamily protein [Chthoniobacterales bacterium]|nr:4'-phosphopantetheinyl transferase superfamily protein [Chthoniobacterales bacterium]